MPKHTLLLQFGCSKRPHTTHLIEAQRVVDVDVTVDVLVGELAGLAEGGAQEEEEQRGSRPHIAALVLCRGRQEED